MPRDNLKRLSRDFEAAERSHEVVPFPRQRAGEPEMSKAHRQYLAQKAMLEASLAAAPATPQDTDRKNQPLPAGDAQAVCEQAATLRYEHIDSIFSSAFLHIAP